MKLIKGLMSILALLVTSSSLAAGFQSMSCPQFEEFQMVEVDRAYLNFNCDQLRSLDRVAADLKVLFGLDVQSPLLRLGKTANFDAAYMSFTNRIDLQLLDLAALSNQKQDAIKAIFAHEYGHFIFLKLLAIYSKSEKLGFFRDLSELQNQMSPDADKLRKISDQFKNFQTPYNYELMAAYNELFADIVASSQSKNPDEIFTAMDTLFGKRPSPEHRCRSMRPPLGLCQEINDPHVWLADIRKPIWDYRLQFVMMDTGVLGQKLTDIAQTFISEIEYFIDQDSDRFSREKAVQRLDRYF